MANVNHPRVSLPLSCVWKQKLMQPGKLAGVGWIVRRIFEFVSSVVVVSFFSIAYFCFPFGLFLLSLVVFFFFLALSGY